MFFRIVQRAVTSNQSLYLSFVNYNATSSAINIGKRKKRSSLSSMATKDIFLANFEQMVNNLGWGNIGFNLNGQYVSILCYLDQAALVATNYDDLNFMLNDLYNKSVNNSLDMVLSDTKWLVY